MLKLFSKVIIFSILLSIPFSGICQTNQIDTTSYRIAFLEPSKTYNKKRFYAYSAATVAIYTGTIVALDQIWYKDFEKAPFHTFNDLGEWEDMDKVGHLFSAWMESSANFDAALWTGVDRKKARWMGAGFGLLYQTSFEVLDGYSKKWGFSFADVGFNTAGALLFLGQDMAWQDQRIKLKVSSKRINYESYTVTSDDGEASMDLQTRAIDLYSGNLAARYIKDYNAQTLWASANIYSFLNNEESRFPKWLNIAVGYGAHNMFGGFENEWEYEEKSYRIPDGDFPRYRQFYLSLDIDMQKIKTKNNFVRLLLRVANTFKIPAPAIEVNTLGKVRVHALHW